MLTASLPAQAPSKAEAKALLELRRETWLKGDLRYLLRGYGQSAPFGKCWPQIRMHKWATDWKAANPDRRGPLITWCRRRAGKSTTTLIYCFEQMIRFPYRNANYVAPYQWQCDDIARPIIDFVLRDAPVDLVFKWRRNTLAIQNPRWKNRKAWSRLTLLGCDSKEGNRIRGLPSASTVILDEARDIEIMDYLMESLLPHIFTGQPDPLLWIITTPPPNLECSLVKRYNAKAERDGRVIYLPGSEDASYSDREAEDILETGDITRTSNAYLREIEAQLIPDTSVAVVPEWHQFKQSCVVQSLHRPRYFVPSVQIDAAYSQDKMAFIWFHLNHEQGVINIEKVVIGDQLSTRDIYKILLDGEKEVWGDMAPAPVRYCGDMEPRLANDLYQDSGLRRDFKRPNGIFIRVERNRDRMEGLKRLRGNIGRIRILEPRCHDLIYQLDFGTVKWDKAHKKIDFVRTAELGHLDAVAALRDLVRESHLLFRDTPPPSLDTNSPDVGYPPGWRGPEQMVPGITYNQGTVTRNNMGLMRNGRFVQ